MPSTDGPTRWVFLACAFFAQSASAYFVVPYVTPANPHAGEQLVVNIGQGLCDSVIDEIGYPQVAQSGNSIHVLLFALRYDNPLLCFLPEGTAIIPFGSFAAVTYSLTVDVFYYGLHGTPQTATLGVVPVVISSGSVPMPAPTMSTPILVILSALLAFAASRRMPGGSRKSRVTSPAMQKTAINPSSPAMDRVGTGAGFTATPPTCMGTTPSVSDMATPNGPGQTTSIVTW
jgi:hypothetical protein